ncbi:MAG: class I SAM-dependent methyltransferase [Nitrospirota bacterium]
MKKKVSSMLKELELTRSLYFNISPETGKFINLLIKNRKYRSILEIGTSNGYSGIWIAEALSHIGGHLHTIESHEKERYILAKENFKFSGLSEYITLILGHAPENLPKTPKMFDMAFFDATKLEHQSYFETIRSRIKKGGMIITDNMISHKKELKPYLNHVQKDPSWNSYLIHIGTGLLISLKK